MNCVSVIVGERVRPLLGLNGTMIAGVETPYHYQQTLRDQKRSVTLLAKGTLHKYVVVATGIAYMVQDWTIWMGTKPNIDIECMLLANKLAIMI